MSKKITRKNLMEQSAAMSKMAVLLRMHEKHKTYRIDGQLMHDISSGLDVWSEFLAKLYDQLPPDGEVIEEVNHGS